MRIYLHPLQLWAAVARTSEVNVHIAGQTQSLVIVYNTDQSNILPQSIESHIKALAERHDNVDKQDYCCALTSLCQGMT